MVPYPSLRRGRPVLRAALAAAVLAVPAAVAVSAPAPARADDGPTVVLTAPDRVRTSEYDNQVWTDFGLRLRVTGAPLEIWSQRPDYDSEVVVTQKLPGGDVALPTGLTDTIGRLGDFVRLRFVPLNDDGSVDEDKKPFARRIDGCLTPISRIVPDATFRSPYPRGCYYNPLAVGSVQGIPAGWTGTAVEEYSGSGIRLRPGKYAVTAQIATPYAEALGIPWGDRRATTTLTVRDRDDRDCERCRLPHGGDVDEPATPLRPETEEPTGRGVGSLADLPEGTPVPDLRSLPAFGIQLNRKGTQLRFSANVWNGGTSDLVVDGFRREDEDVMDAYQYFLDDDGEVVAYEPVGEMEWDPDPTHRHWHFTDFATYRLLARDKETAVVSGKEAFCLANTDAVDLTAPGANWTVSYDDLGSVCGGRESQAIREVLAAGWGDTYAQFRAGQAFPVAKVPDGVYFIQVLANPDQNLIEADTTNNESLRRIRLTTNANGERRVWVAPVGIVDETTGMFG